jgi:arginase
MRVNVLGVPNSAGAYCVGVERAPAALREAGLIESLAANDAGDLTTRRWAPDRERRYVQNLDAEVAALKEATDAAAALLAEGELLLLLGGSCTVAIASCAALARRFDTARLVYIDRHLDLNTPSSTDEGSLSWMGMAHALGVDGAAAELVHATRDEPVLESSNLVYLGVDTTQATDGERSQLEERGITVVPQRRLVDDPRGAAETARGALGSGPFAVHVDVDVLDFIDAPLAENVNGRNSGPTIEQLGAALGVLLQHPECIALSIGQLVPAHASADPTALPRLVEALAAAVSSRESAAAPL